MGAAWVLVFAVAAGVTLITTPPLRRLALRIDLVDRPTARKIHAVPVPYLGGVAIAFGVLAGLAVAPSLGWQAGVVALGAAVVASVGLIDDDRQLRATTRLAVEGVAALAVVATGLRLEATGADVVDAGLTVVWIVGLTNALNLLDNMDGLGAGVAAAIAGSTLVLAVAGGGEPWVAALAAALAAASLVFLVFNLRPAHVFMGDAGSLFLGYLLAVVTVAATQPLPSRPGLAVPLMLCAVPIADTATVVVGRLRHGLRVALGGKDHLSHRLVARGLSPGVAVIVLVAAASILGVLGSLAGRRVVALAGAVALGAVVLCLVLVAALRAVVYAEPSVGFPNRLRVAASATIVAAVVVAGAGFAPIGAGHRMVQESRASTLAESPRGAASTITGGEEDARNESGRMPPRSLLAACIAGLGVVLLTVARRPVARLPEEEKVIDLRVNEQGDGPAPERVQGAGMPAEHG